MPRARPRRFKVQRLSDVNFRDEEGRPAVLTQIWQTLSQADRQATAERVLLKWRTDKPSAEYRIAEEWPIGSVPRPLPPYTQPPSPAYQDLNPCQAAIRTESFEKVPMETVLVKAADLVQACMVLTRHHIEVVVIGYAGTITDKMILRLSQEARNLLTENNINWEFLS